MALIKCPECGKEISDKAPACIHCGYPLSLLNNEKAKSPTVEKQNNTEAKAKENQKKYSFKIINCNVIIILALLPLQFIILKEYFF